MFRAGALGIAVIVVAAWAATFMAIPLPIAQEQAYGIETQQETESAPQNEQGANRVPAPARVTPKENTTVNAADGSEQGSEYWPPFLGLRIKVTDSLLVLFTGVLAWFTRSLDKSTDKLWRATREAIEKADATSERQFGQMKEYISATKISAESLHLAQRAWVVIDWDKTKFIEPITWDGKTGRTVIEFVVYNMGNTLARNVAIQNHIYLSNNMNLGPIVAGAIKSDTFRGLMTGATIFPGESLMRRHVIKIDEATLSRYSSEIGWDIFSSKSSMPLMIVTCIGYALSFSDQAHQTVYSFAVAVDGSSFKDLSPANGNIPVERLSLHRHLFADIVAN